MFSLSDSEFIANYMKIDVTSIESKLNEPFMAEFKSLAVESVAKYIEVIKMFEASGIERDLLSFTDNEAEEFIRAHYCNLTDNIENDSVLQIFDSLRHSFSCYAYNGLHQLYVRQENETWHPKIRLTDELEPNDIHTLEPIIKIYRGCDIEEFDMGVYGQAWSTSLEVAQDFAYKHYRNQGWFVLKNRVVVKTSYSKNNLLFSCQSIEFEVVVDTDKIEHVHKHT